MTTVLTETIQKSSEASLGRFPDVLYIPCFVLLYAVLANVPFWAAEGFVGIVPGGTWCVEYIAIGILALFLRNAISAALLSFAIAADILCGVSRTYELAPLDCLKTISCLGAFNGVRLASFAAVIAITLTVVAAAALLPVQRIPIRQKLFVAISLTALLVVGLATDYLAIARLVGHFPSPWKRLSATDGMRAELRTRPIFRRPCLQLLQEQKALGYIERVELTNRYDGTSVGNASHLALPSLDPGRFQHTQMEPNVVVILVESWGIFENRQARDSLVSMYLGKGISERYEIIQGEIPFHGSTVAGESRELCGQDLGFGILTMSPQLFRNCLPERLRALGFHTLAAHGNSGHFFRRTDWYRRMGFEEQWFRSDFQRAGLSECVGTVLGTCDAAIAQWIGTKLESYPSPPQLIYWVTLNSHLPVPIPSNAGSAFGCTNLALVSRDPSICSWYRLVGTVQHSIADLAMVDTPRPTVFVVVGDHAPPFADPNLRTLFSRTEVPYLVLIPRSNQVPDPKGISSLPPPGIVSSAVPQRPQPIETRLDRAP